MSQLENDIKEYDVFLQIGSDKYRIDSELIEKFYSKYPKGSPIMFVRQKLKQEVEN